MAVDIDTQPIAAVLWDMDGTLIDTEPLWMASEFELVAEHGGQWPDEAAHWIIGFGLRSAARVLQDHGVGLEVDAIVYDLMRRVVDRLAAGDLPWRPGARELLAACREAKIPTALVTMSWRPLTDAALAGIESAVPDPFVITVAGDEVSESKPSPAPYLLAARRLGVDPTRCIAIEDSPTGTASAVAAGCATIGVESHAPLAPRPGLHILPTLAGVGIGDLEAVLASHR